MVQSRLVVDGNDFRDSQGRQVTLRGINVAGDAKFPSRPDQPSHIPTNFFNGDTVSFVGRPFPVDEAHKHFGRLKRWGYNTIRYIFTWEAVEHSGPGKYDEEWIQHTIELLRIAKEYGFYVFLDPHQDVWSRFTGGSGAPLWTLYACGLNPETLAASEAAFVQNTDPDPANYPKMLWPTNYTRLACQALFTLFFAGRDFAPNAIIDGQNIQDYLQGHFIGACRHLAEKIREAGDLEDVVVIGWESMNEPNKGLIGYQDLSSVPGEQKLQKGTSPTAWQAILTGSGRACEIDTYDFGGMGSYKTGSRLVDPKGESAWLPADHDDTRYGWKRDPNWKLGECVWAQHGVWDPSTDMLLKKEYFARHPHTGEKIDYEFFTNNYFMEFYRRTKDAIRAVHGTSILFCQPPVLEIPPAIKGTEDDDPNMVFAPHYYDGITLMTKSWNRIWNVDVFGILRGRYLSPAFAVRVGETAIRNCLRDQISAIRKEGIDFMGQHPCVLTEIGIPYDMDKKQAYNTGDYSSQSLAMDANHFAMEGSGIAGFTLWLYTATNDHRWGDQWNGEDLSIFSVDDRPLPMAPSELADFNASRTSLNPSPSGNGQIESPPVSPANLKESMSTPSISSAAPPTSAAVSEKGGFRAAEAYVRPSPIVTAGQLKSYGFDLRSCVFTLSLSAPAPATSDAPTVIFLPQFHFPEGKTNVEVSGGKWSIQVEDEAGELRTLKWWNDKGPQDIRIRGAVRRAGLAMGKEEEEEGHHPEEPTPSTNGVDSPPKSNGAHSEYVSQVLKALQAIHEPRSSNETRQHASTFLEQAKYDAEAPSYGFSLASDKSQPPVIRHYALSILEYAIRHNWADYSEEQSTAIRDWIVHLAQSVATSDPAFVRNKTAQLWVDIAKRSWASEWMNMDELLVGLWSAEYVHKELVAVILETLSEDVFTREDATASMRGIRLSRACVEIFTPESVLREQQPSRESSAAVRYGGEGWLARFTNFLGAGMPPDRGAEEQAVSCVVKVLAALKAALSWSMPKALGSTRCVEQICHNLISKNDSVQMASIEALHTLYCRPLLRDEDFLLLVCPMYRPEAINLLSKVYQSTYVDPSDIDESKYALSKKLSEMVSNLANSMEQKQEILPQDSDIRGFLGLLLGILRSSSLMISIPVLSSWAKLLRSDATGGSEAVGAFTKDLLEICSQRLLRFESLPEDADNPTVLFLNEDIDTTPERHAFLGNYRRYSSQVVESITRRKPFDALYHILHQVDQSFQTLYDGFPPFRVDSYSKASMPLLRLDANCTLVEAALKGYRKYVLENESGIRDSENTMEDNLQTWCERLLDTSFEDPLMRKRVLQLAVVFATSVLEKRTNFMLNVLKHILTTQRVGDPEHPVYNEAVKDLQNDCTHELQRLAFKMPDDLLAVYSDLEAKISEIVSTTTVEDRTRLSFYSFLFIICHRSTTIDPSLREQRLRSFIAPIGQAWQDANLSEALESLEGFCDVAGVARVQQYLVSRQVHKIEDWSSYQLDEEGKSIQSEMNDKLQNLPIRSTKSFLGASVEKIKKPSEQYEMAAILWRDIIRVMLPSLLNLLSYAHAFHNGANWPGLSEDMQPIVTRTLTDRFWQAGISTGSRDDFYARVSGTKTTLEGFASSVRGTIRTIREGCYSILYCLSKLDANFYGIPDLPQPLAQALFGDAKFLSSHQLSTMMNMVRYLIDECPTSLREQFLPPVLSSLFEELDAKVSGEWDNLIRRAQSSSDDDNLTNEMKEESILRQLTYTSVLLVASLLDPQRENPPDPNAADQPPPSPSQAAAQPPRHPHVTQPGSMRAFVLSSLPILRPLILFCTHALHMRDSRSCAIIIRVFRSIVPDFASPSPQTSSSTDPSTTTTAPNEQDTTTAAIREHISHSVLQAAITSLHASYFVDLQKDLASLIATIFTLYTPLTATPRQVLLSLPGVSAPKLDRTANALFAVAGNGRQQRALVLELLESVRGVSVAEMGRWEVRGVRRGGGGGGAGAGKTRSEMQEGFMRVDEGRKEKEASPDLGGVADMFG
ncbi:MAG: hypothetical protein M1833_002336 [Piccolia ochrophora]|nr:MAG: hypothetical protein M1833_002336 [Piccolia ochrophora]